VGVDDTTLVALEVNDGKWFETVPFIVDEGEIVIVSRALKVIDGDDVDVADGVPELNEALDVVVNEEQPVAVGDVVVDALDDGVNVGDAEALADFENSAGEPEGDIVVELENEINGLGEILGEADTDKEALGDDDIRADCDAVTQVVVDWEVETLCVNVEDSWGDAERSAEVLGVAEELAHIDIAAEAVWPLAENFADVVTVTVAESVVVADADVEKLAADEKLWLPDTLAHDVIV
jgi:hypothetical protein